MIVKKKKGNINFVFLGNDVIYVIIFQCKYELKIILIDFQQYIKIVEYFLFFVGDKLIKYVFSILGYFGDVGWYY